MTNLTYDHSSVVSSVFLHNSMLNIYYLFIFCFLTLFRSRNQLIIDPISFLYLIEYKMFETSSYHQTFTNSYVYYVKK